MPAKPSGTSAGRKSVLNQADTDTALVVISRSMLSVTSTSPKPSKYNALTPYGFIRVQPDGRLAERAGISFVAEHIDSDISLAFVQSPIGHQAIVQQLGRGGFN
jgi:hypothetical protein